jgi:integrase
MTIHRRRDSGAWEVSVHGKRYSNRTWSYAEAKRFETEKLNTTTLSLEAAMDRWLAEHAAFLKDPDDYRAKAEHLRPLLKGRSLEEAQDVAADARRAWARLKPATINRRLAILRRVCNLAFSEWNIIDKPVGKRIKLLPERNTRHIYLTRAQVEALRMACPNSRAGDLVVFAAFTGLRWSEMFRVCSTDVHDGALRLNPRTKNDRPRTVPLHPRALHIALQMPLDISENETRRSWETARERCNLKHVHWHDLRHTFASWLAQKGTRLQTIQALLGHSTITTTMRYAHLVHDNLKEAVEQL